MTVDGKDLHEYLDAEELAALTANPARVLAGLPVLPYVDLIGPRDRRHLIGGAVEEILGITADEYEAATHEELNAMIWPEDLPRIEESVQAMRTNLAVLRTTEYRMRSRSGRTVWFRDLARGNLAGDGTLVLRGVMIDVTKEKELEFALASSESLSRQIVSSADVGMVVLDCELRYRVWNRYMESLCSTPDDTMLGLTPEQAVAPTSVPFPAFEEKLRRALAGETLQIADTHPYPQQDGSTRYCDVTAGPLHTDSGETVGVLVLVRDISPRQTAEQALRRRDRILDAVSIVARLLLEHPLEDCVNQSLALLGEAVGASRASIFRFEQVGGLTAEQELWQWCAEGIERDVVDDHVIEGSAFASVFHALNAGRTVHGPTERMAVEFRPHLRQAGIQSAAFTPIVVDGKLWGNLDFDDCTTPRVWSSAEIDAIETAASLFGAALARQHAEAALRESESLRGHSQRMEAVGRLAGGLAHDFNNVLTVITGHLELARSQLPDGCDAAADLDQIALAADRASTLTRQLLTFSRRQVINARVIDLNAVILEIDAMLAQLVEDSVELRFKLNPDPVRILADPVQVQQVLVNLVVNARDAMPDGGQLEIETSLEPTSVSTPGRALLAVTDTGSGIDEAARAHIFEPFFTTKPRGQGVGLGLAIVHGIVTEARGQISIDSTAGWGTTFLIRFPEARALVEHPADEEPPGGDVDYVGSERVLVVEDETPVRLLVKVVLEKRGYTVFTAADGIEGLGLVRAHGTTLDLVISDVVMPRMSGRELSERLLTEFPEIPVILMSGYTDGEFVTRRPLDPSVPFLQKAFRPADLARIVRETLDARREAPAA